MKSAGIRGILEVQATQNLPEDPAMAKISGPSLVRNEETDGTAPSLDELRQRLRAAARAAESEAEALCSQETISFREAERALREVVFALGRALVVLFLALREARLDTRRAPGRVHWFGKVYRPAPPIGRQLTTMFGTVRYWRTYMRQVAKGKRCGFHPLDMDLGLSADRLSWNVLSRVVRLATELSFARARAVMSDFVPNTPSTEVIQQALLGFGAHAEAFFEQQPAPEDDGEVLVVQFDGKGVPTATKRELRRRRRKRRKRSKSGSPRHRGRDKRARHPSLPRRKKGDKSKNAKMATMVVMYTLRRKGTRRLEGPINRRHYVSFAPKRHAFIVARREADKRGFTQDAGRLVQVVTDGDNDLADLTGEYFPEAEHTVDIFHVFEKLWEAGGAFLKEGSDALRAWVDEQKQRLFDDDVEAVMGEMDRRLELIPKTGPGNKGRRERLAKATAYLRKRARKIRYGSLRRRDLVLATGDVEGAIKHVLAKRCDQGGMRWTKERVQAVAQLRCIDVNGDWEAFERFVHDRLSAAARLNRGPERLQTKIPQPLPIAA